jgi:purine nucleoside phosphorylase
MTRAVLGIIGGSGIYDLPGLEDVREETIESPWGEPSAALTRGVIGACRSCSCRGTARDMCCRLPISTTAPISMC